MIFDYIVQQVIMMMMGVSCTSSCSSRQTMTSWPCPCQLLTVKLAVQWRVQLMTTLTLRSMTFRWPWPETRRTASRPQCLRSALNYADITWSTSKSATLPFDNRCCHMGTAIRHPVPDRVKPSFVIFDIRALWRSGLSVRVPGCQKSGHSDA